MKKYGLILTIAIAFVLAFSIGAFAQEVKVGAGAAPSNSILKRQQGLNSPLLSRVQN